MKKVSEAEVVYQEGGEVRILRGSLARVDEAFVHLQRRDGTYRIARDRIVLIHCPEQGEGDYDGDQRDH
jgi:hypothetical protein